MTPSATPAAAALLAAAGLAQAACSLQNPYAPPTPPAPPARPATGPGAGDPAPERDGTIPAAARQAQATLAPAAAAASPQQALYRYAQIAVNWSASDLAATERRLASISLAQARAQALQAAAQATSFRGEQNRNAGRPVSIARGQAQAAGQWVIVTLEQTSGHGPYAGLPETLHVTFAQVTHTPDGYAVDQWHPQN